MVVGAPLAVHAATAPKPGTACKPVGKTIAATGAKYTCVRSKGKLVWGKPVKSAQKPVGVETESPKPAPTPSAIPTPIAEIAPTAMPKVPATVSASRYAFQQKGANGLPVHWSTCSPITWTYFPEPTRPYALGTVQASLQIIANATGFTFKYVDPGAAQEPKWNVIGNPDSPSTPAQLQIFFGDTSNVPQLTGDTWGTTPLYWETNSGLIQIAYVVIRPEVKYGTKDFGNLGMGLLILHELGHAMGLEHVSSTADLMYPDLGAITVTNFAAGDLAGLYQVSAAIPCGK